MNPLVRWSKFNLVGIAGALVQLSTLALLTRIEPAHYLWSTAIAIELTLLHNFAWHIHFTWRDRRQAIPLAEQLLRFHLSNGLISLVGNLMLMRLLVQHSYVPVIPANCAAILLCSVVNFAFGDRWVFAPMQP